MHVPTNDEEWKQKLDPLQYAVLREKATERPHTGKFDQHWSQGRYVCAGCGELLFSSEQKFDAGCGWPSFSDASGAVREQRDTSHGMQRTEVLCSTCGGHLGHLFDDGPAPSGQRYCINSAALEFAAAEKKHNPDK